MKVCTKCCLKKQNTCFSFKNKKLNRRHAICKDCHNKYVKEKQYFKYRKKHAENVAKWKKSKSLLLYNYYLENPCIDCGEDNPILLESDHVRGNKFSSISNMIGDFGWSKVLKELEKCETRCANCHRLKTAKERNYIFWQIRNNAE